MTYETNINEILTRLKSSLSEEGMDRLNREVAQALYASNLVRVHSEGRNVENRSIGSYSTRPTYVSVNAGPRRLQPQGRNGNTGPVGTRPRTSRFFQRGYRQFREEVGRRGDTVDLELSGRLRTDFRLLKGGGTSYHIGFVSDRYSRIADGLEAHFGGSPIWGVTADDEQLVERIVERYVKNI